MGNTKKLRLGELLIEAGILKPEQLEKALAIQEKRQLRLGTILLQEGFIAESQLVQALSLRLSIPWVSLWRIDIKDELLSLVPVSVAEEFFLIPIYIRSEPGGQRALYVAMNDPTDEAALRFVAASSGLNVKPMIAGPSDIAAAIRAYYYGEEAVSEAPPPSYTAPAGKQVTSRPPPPQPAAPGQRVSLPPQVPPQAAALAAASEEEKRRARREVEKHMFGVGSKKTRKGISLTLLDGTTISFGETGSRGKPARAFTEEDLLKGLRARASGAPRDDLLPANAPEEYLAAILEILFRKRLILFEELMAELNKRKK